MFGRPYQTVYDAASGTPTSYSYYNAEGQLDNQVDPDGVSTIYQYNAKGQQDISSIEVNGDTSINFGGADRITARLMDVTTYSSTTVQRLRNYAWETFSSNASNLLTVVQTSADGLRTWQTRYRDPSTSATSSTQTTYGGSGSRTVTATAADNSYSISVYSYGRLTSVTRYDSTGAQIGETSYSYDTQGRQYAITDARNGTTTYGFNNADQVVSQTTPAPGPGQSPETTATSYDLLGRQTGQTLPDGTTTTSSYYPNGLLAETYGSRVYPVAYTYDYAGRMKTMTNWSNFATSSGARGTLWSYDAYRGFLTGKTYDGGAAGPAYTNSLAGRLIGRAWARNVGTSYSYDTAGDLATVAYSDGTAGVNYGYDRRGRQIAVTNGATICSLSYDDANDLLTESYTGGPLNGQSVTNAFDSLLRRTGVGLASQPSTVEAFSYDNASRLQSVANGSDTATYSYLANSPLVSQITFKQSSTTRMTTTKQYDLLNRLTSISSVGTGSTPSPISFNYTYNSANQRTEDSLADGSYWRYSYDSLGQVISGMKYWSDETPVAGQQFNYSFDTIGNRTSTSMGGDARGGNLWTSSYAANSLNQYTSRSVPGSNDVIGVAIATNSVTVNSMAAYRKVEYYQGTAGSNNTVSAIWQGVTNTCGGNTVIGNIFIPQTPENFTYDADGNLTSDGRWTNQWDAENRLISMTSLSTNPSASWMRLGFQYDWKGRRASKVVSNYVGSAWSLVSSNCFAYDGWNLLAELNSSGSPIRSFAWGMDLSGTIQDAGGVGGLLQSSYYGSGTTNCFVAFDGNGNVAALVNAADGSISANYEYGPFGEVIRATGPMAEANSFTFQTEYYDWEAGDYYWKHRYYGPSAGRWLSEDPLLENAFRLLHRRLLRVRTTPNLYVFVANDPLDRIDILGLCTPGCNRASCVVRVTPAGTSPDTSQQLSELADLYDDTEDVGTMYAAGSTAAAGLGEVSEQVATGIGEAVGTGLSSPGQALSQVSQNLLNEMGPHNGGWTAWIFASYQTCESRCWLMRKLTGEDGYWKDLAGSKDWEPVSGPLVGGGFDGPDEALKAGQKACKDKTSDFRRYNKMCE